MRTGRPESLNTSFGAGSGSHSTAPPISVLSCATRPFLSQKSSSHVRKCSACTRSLFAPWGGHSVARGHEIMHLACGGAWSGLAVATEAAIPECSGKMGGWEEGATAT